MEQIKIGTIVQGDKYKQQLSEFVKYGFETFQLNWHMELNNADLEKIAQDCKEILADSGKKITTLGLYCNPLTNQSHYENLKYVIDSAALFGATTVGTFAGALEGEPVEASIPRFKEVFSELAKRAADKGLNLVIENCPMGGSWKKATCNIGFNPRAWDMMFEAVPDKNFGLEWEPTHQMVQLIDPLPQLKQYKSRILHIHGKDATIDREAISRMGILGEKPFVYHRFPGFGDNNWRDIFFWLYMNGYEGDICIEGFHDPVYRKDWEMTGQLHALEYLKFCRGGDFTPAQL